MPAHQVELDARTKELVDALVRDMGVACTGIDDEGYIVFEAYLDIPPDRQASLGEDIMQVIMSDSVDEAIVELRKQTLGINVRA